jgi:hypothetical protein
MNKSGRQLRSPIRWSLYLWRQSLDRMRRLDSLLADDIGVCGTAIGATREAVSPPRRHSATSHIAARRPPIHHLYAIGRRPIILWSTEFSILKLEHRSTPWNCMYLPAPITQHGGQSMEPHRRAGIRCRCSMHSSTLMILTRGPCGVAITRRDRLRPDQRSRNEHRWACDEAVQRRLFQTFYVKERDHG